MRFGHKTKKFKVISGSSPIFALSNFTTFSQTQIGATVPLNMLGHFPECLHYILRAAQKVSNTL
jgi:hypothetical protein